MPANNVLGNPAAPPEKGPTLHFVVGFDDMDQQGRGIALAAYQAHGIKIQIVPAIGITAPRPTKDWPADHITDQMFPYHFSVSPELAWISEVLAESVDITPAPFIVELEYNRAGAGKAGLAAAPANLPATALSGITVTPGIREMVTAEQDDILRRLAELRSRFPIGDHGAASREQRAANAQCRKDNRGEVLGIYPMPDLPEQEIRIAQRLPYELGPCFMLGREFPA